MNKILLLIVVFLCASFLNQIASDFYFRESIIRDKKRLITSKQTYENCIKTNPKHTKAMLNLAFLFIRTEGKAGIEKAYKILEDIEEIDYYFPDVHYRKATILCEWSSWDEAIKEYHIALEQRSSNEKAYYDLGRVYYWGKKDLLQSKKYFLLAKKHGTSQRDVTDYLNKINNMLKKSGQH